MATTKLQQSKASRRIAISYWTSEVACPEAFWRELKLVSGLKLSSGEIGQLERLMHEYRSLKDGFDASAKPKPVEQLLKEVTQAIEDGASVAAILRLRKGAPSLNIVARAAFERIQSAARVLDGVHLSRRDLPSMLPATADRYVQWALKNLPTNRGRDGDPFRTALLVESLAAFQKATGTNEKYTPEAKAFLLLIARQAGAHYQSEEAMTKDLQKGLAARARRR